jgi:tetratricopeptide (TPR) repeat protein
LARELVAKRGRAFDYGLLGDVLMEQGRLEEAVTAYQQMADLKPDLQAYTRAAHMRWLKGDLEGAIEAMQMAVQAGSPRDPESVAWVNSRMALYQLQAGNFAASDRCCETALTYQPDYAPALLVQGRLRLTQGNPGEAVTLLRRAAGLNPLPEYFWVLAESLHATGSVGEAAEVESKLKLRGEATDPRTYALYLATRGEHLAMAARLAEAELESRQDAFTRDALAWTLAAQGRWTQAGHHMKRALSEGTQDARLLLHAGVIAAETGDQTTKARCLNDAKAIEQMLLPSERALLAKYLAKDKPLTTAEMKAGDQSLSKSAF